MIHIAGLTPFTTIDYPGALSLVLFCQGCPWQCGYCHNPHLQPFSKGIYAWDQIIALLKSRVGLLDAVVFSGGEPVMQKNLLRAIQEVKSLGFKAGLHTAGIQPVLLKPLLPHLNWVGMDIKAPFESYERVTRIRNSGCRAKESALTLIQSGIPYEFRTTVHPNLLTLDDLDRLTLQLVEMGGKHFVLQKFQPNGCVNRKLLQSPSDPVWPGSFLDKLRDRFETFLVREG